MRKALIILTAMVVLGSFMVGPGLASSDENLYVCRPCSRGFVEVAEKVIEELGLQDEITVKTTGCLGYCSAPAVIRFQNEVYSGMNEEKLRMMLQALVVLES